MTSTADLGALARGVIGVGFTGTTPGTAPLEALRAFGPGALILFARNVGTTEDLRDLVFALRATASPPPLITVDQEGGRVERIHDGVAALPSAMAVGATADAATLRARDLIPFERAIAGHAASIVITAHVVIEAFDPDRPATLSRKVLTDLLRGELGYDGVVATDCLEMDAIAGGIGTVRGAVEALAAGADLLLISHRLELAERAAEAIVAAVGSGELPRERLEEAHARVLALRERLAHPPALADGVDEAWPLDAARRAVTVLRGDPHLRAGKPVTVISFEGDEIDNVAASGAIARKDELPSLNSALRRRGWKSEMMRVPLEPMADDVDLLLEHIPALGDREFVVVTRDAHLYPGQQDAVMRILALAPDALIVSARSPYDTVLWPQARRMICIYRGQIVSD